MARKGSSSDYISSTPRDLTDLLYMLSESNASKTRLTCWRSRKTSPYRAFAGFRMISWPVVSKAELKTF